MLSLVLVLWDLVLLYKMSVEFKGAIFSNYFRRVKWKQGVTVGVGVSVYNVWDRRLYIITLVQWCGGWQSKLLVQWSGIVTHSGSVGFGYQLRYCEHSVENQ